MTRIHTLPGNVSIWVYADHMPPHFHVRSASSNAQVDMRTLQVIRGRCTRKEYAAIVAWASEEANMALVLAEWRKLNERD